MKKAAAPLAAALFALVLATPGVAQAEDFIDLDNPGGWLLVPEWIFGAVGTGFGYALHVRPVPVLAPRLGCYFSRERLDGAWRQVQVCY
jgi:hypothetical protein